MLILILLISFISVISTQFGSQLFGNDPSDTIQPIVQKLIKPLGPNSSPPDNDPFNPEDANTLSPFKGRRSKGRRGRNFKPTVLGGPGSLTLDEYQQKYENNDNILESATAPMTRGPGSLTLDEYQQKYENNDNIIESATAPMTRGPGSLTFDEYQRKYENNDNVMESATEPMTGGPGSSTYKEYQRKYDNNENIDDNESFKDNADSDSVDFDLPMNDNIRDPFDSSNDSFIKQSNDIIEFQENNRFPSRCPFNKKVGTSYNYKAIFTLKKRWSEKHLDKSTSEYQSIREKIHLQTLFTYVDNFEYIDSLLLQLDNKYNQTRATVILRFTKNEQNADLFWRSIKCCFSDCEFFNNKDFEIFPISNDNVAELCVGMCANAYVSLSSDICIDNCPAQCCSMQNFLNLYSNMNQMSMCPSFCEYNCMPNTCQESCCSRMGMKRNLLEKTNVLNQKSIGKLI